jgi:hypothetical protein
VKIQMPRSTKFAHRCQKVWLDLVSMKEERKAVAMGKIVDALFADDPETAIRCVRHFGLDVELISQIRAAFGLTDDG